MLVIDLYVKLMHSDDESKHKENLIRRNWGFAEKLKQKCSFNFVSLK